MGLIEGATAKRRTEPVRGDAPTAAPSEAPVQSEAPAPAPAAESSTPTVTASSQSRAFGRAAARAREDQLRIHLLNDTKSEEPAASVSLRGRRGFMIDDATPLTATAASTTTEGFQALPGGGHRFRGTSGDDAYTVTQASGDLTVTNDSTGATYTLAAADVRAGVEIQTYRGDDQITIDASVYADLDIHGGAGNDFINGGDARGDLAVHGGLGNDTIMGGRGDDDLDGDGGDDRVFGGAGDDILHGGGGDDSLFGRAGDDQLWGEAGDDSIHGGADGDIVVGGAGADIVNGGVGSDVLYADADDTSINAGANGGNGADADIDQVVAEDGATVKNLGADDVVATYDPEEVDQWLDDHPELRISGPNEFRDRVRADLGVLLNTTEGRGLLDDLGAALETNGETLNITEVMGSAHYYPGRNEAESSSATWNYRDGILRTPTTALFHELVHGYQDLVGPDPAGSTMFSNGREAENDELAATGLSWLDASNNPGTSTYSENALRRELGLPERTQYGFESGTADTHVP